MSKNFPEFTDKMEYLFADIIGSLGQLPIEQRGYLFGYEDEEDMEWIMGMACYITMEYIKYAFDYDDPTYSLRHFLKTDADDERMLQQRTLEYVFKYKKRELQNWGIELPEDHKFANIDMSDIEKKLKGYRLTEMNIFEQQNIHDLELIKAIVQNRISSSKKISNQDFADLFEKYDDFIVGLKTKALKSDKDMVFYSIAIFTFEWHYPVEAFYDIARIMEEEKIHDISKSDSFLLFGDVDIESQFGGWWKTPSRMVKERFIFLDSLFRNEMNPLMKEELRRLVKEMIVLGVQYKEVLTCKDGRKYIDWFRTESNMCDWASFFRYYDIFSIWKKKEWTPKRIQNMRKLFEMTSMKKL